MLSDTTVKIPGVPHIRQFPELARGCEVTSLAMLLNYAGVTVNKMELAETITKVPFQKNGLYGNPNEGFVGDIYTYDRPGYGVYHKPIAELFRQYLGERVLDLTGEEIGAIYDMVEAGKPVLVVTNSWFRKLHDCHFTYWETKQGKVKITYRDHCVVVTGYSPSHVYIHDPLYPVPYRKVMRKPFEEAWYQMGRQAISYVDNVEGKKVFV